MNTAERFLALRSTPPFTGLYDGELLQLASVVGERRLAAGACVAREQARLGQLHIVVHGGVETGEGHPVPAVFDVAGVLFDRPVPNVLRAGPGGAVCLTLEKAHFFTLITESPGLLVALIEGSDPPGSGALEGEA